MQAAERIFDGAFDDVVDEPENMQRNTAKVEATRKARMIVSVIAPLVHSDVLTSAQTPDEDEEDDLEDVEDDDGPDNEEDDEEECELYI